MKKLIRYYVMKLTIRNRYKYAAIPYEEHHCDDTQFNE